MKNQFTCTKQSVILFLFFGYLLLLPNRVSAQITTTVNKTINTLCNGSNCDYSGPSILINEMMMSPSTYNGCLSGTFINGACRGEWIELYNPNLCEPIDISCYYLGSNVYLDAITQSQGVYILPQGTVIPPGGFCLIRGENAPPVVSTQLVQNGGNVVEIVIPPNITDPGLCVNNDTRFWFPDAGGWFGFFDSNGAIQDAVSWGNFGGTTVTVNCIPVVTGCNNSVTNLGSYNLIPANRKTVVYSGSPPLGQTVRRLPDGGAWVTNQGTAQFTMGACNGVCAQPSSSTCDGSATVTPTSGTAPYTYSWNDSQAQLTQTATGLCAGTYQCTVRDANNQLEVVTVVIEEYVPTVTVTIQPDICINGGLVNLSNVSPVATAGQTNTITGTGLTGQSFNPQTAGAGQHIITHVFLDENGCTNTAKDTINVHALPIVSIAGLNSTYCLSLDVITPTLTPQGGTLSGPGVTNNTFISANAGVGSHTLTYTYTDQYGCENTTTFNLTVYSAPPPTFTIQPVICSDAAPIALTASPTGGVFASNGNTISDFNPANYTAGDHIVMYTITVGTCMSQAQDTIRVIGKPVLSSNLSNYCFGTAIVSLTFSPNGGTATGDHLSGTTLDLTSVAPGDYAIQYNYTDEFGCSNVLNQNYALYAPFYPLIKFEGDCFQQAHLSPAVHPANANYNYFWNFGDQGNSTAQNPVVKYPTSGNHTISLTVTDQNNCVFDTVQNVFIKEGIGPNTFVIPNVITPNNDGVNDFISFLPLVDECITYSILFLNRWGNVVFEMKDASTAFSGKDAKGQELTDGVYFYMLKSDDIDCDAEEFQGMCNGFITILRK